MPPVSGRAVVADALELMKESGVTNATALLESARRAGLQWPADGWLEDWFVKALGPAALPLLDSGYQLHLGLTHWRLASPDTVMPALLERGQHAFGEFKGALRSLAENLR